MKETDELDELKEFLDAVAPIDWDDELDDEE